MRTHRANLGPLLSQRTAIYPPDQVPWGDWLKTKFWQVTHKKPPLIPLLPESQQKTIVRSNPLKRRLPVDYVKKGPAKRPRGPVPLDTRPDSGQDFRKDLRYFRRPHAAPADTAAPPPAHPWEIIVARRNRTQTLEAAFPNGWDRIPLPTLQKSVTQDERGQVTYKTIVSPPDPGLPRAVWAIQASITQQYPGMPYPTLPQFTTYFNDFQRNHANDWLEVRKHKGYVDPSYGGPKYFADHVAGALWEWGRDVLDMDLALGVCDSRALPTPFVHPLPNGHNRDARIVWVFYDGMAARWRPTPPRRDNLWQLGDFDYWYGVQPHVTEEVRLEPEVAVVDGGGGGGGGGSGA